MPINSHWWMCLPAIPSAEEDRDYRRLRKIWADKTRFRGRDSDRKHEFFTPTYETHLMTTLWENFSLYEPKQWLGELASVSGVANNHASTTRCDWSYGFRDYATARIADIVIGFDGVGPGTGCYLIEAKRPKGKLGPKDLDPSYYLDLEKIQSESDSRNLIYCVDAKEKERVQKIMHADPDTYAGCGALSWEEVGGIQIRLAKKLDLPQKVRSFIAGAIQYQYCQHDIIPSEFSESYLANEPSVQDVFDGVQKEYDNHDLQWSRIGDKYSG